MSILWRTKYSAADKAKLLASNRFDCVPPANLANQFFLPDEDNHQSTIPEDPQLMAKLGLAKSEKLHFFCAYTGDWARALSEHCIVHASDISYQNAALLRSKKGKIRSVFRIAAQIAKLKQHGPFDWSISYEPYPVTDPAGSFEHVLRLSLLNRRGLKMIFNAEPQNVTLMMDHSIPGRMSSFAKLYGAKFVLEERAIQTTTGPSLFRIYSLHTNGNARKLAGIDLFTDLHFHGAASKESVVSLAVSKLGISAVDAEKSIRRVIKSRRTGMLTFG